MRTISLTPYTIKNPERDEKTGVVSMVERPFDVKQSLVNVLFGQGANGRELIKRDAIARKIETTKGAKVLLEEEEYQTLLGAFRAWQTFSRNEVELINRVEEAPVVPVRPDKRR